MYSFWYLKHFIVIFKTDQKTSLDKVFEQFQAELLMRIDCRNRFYKTMKQYVDFYSKISQSIDCIICELVSKTSEEQVILDNAWAMTTTTKLKGKFNSPNLLNIIIPFKK